MISKKYLEQKLKKSLKSLEGIQEFSLKRKRSGYGLPKNSSRHTKEKPISSTRTIGIMNADIVAQTSEKDPWDFFPATSTIARSKQYGKSVPISPLTDSSHSV